MKTRERISIYRTQPDRVRSSSDECKYLCSLSVQLSELFEEKTGLLSTKQIFSFISDKETEQVDSRYLLDGDILGGDVSLEAQIGWREIDGKPVGAEWIGLPVLDLLELFGGEPEQVPLNHEYSFPISWVPNWEHELPDFFISFLLGEDGKLHKLEKLNETLNQCFLGKYCHVDYDGSQVLLHVEFQSWNQAVEAIPVIFERVTAFCCGNTIIRAIVGSYAK